MARMPTSTAGKAPSKQSGFTYVMVLAAVVIVGILVEAAHLSTWRALQADREAELLFRGMAYRRAIESFYRANGVYPRELEDLIKDPKANARRHLRALYSDPMGKGEKNPWVAVHAAGGGIAGVVSSSEGEPLKRANFPVGLERFGAAKSYQDWVFEYVAPRPPARRIPVAPASSAAQVGSSSGLPRQK